MSGAEQFSRYAKSYQKYKIIQSRVASHLVSNTPFKGRKILDLGAGSGEVYKNIDWEFDLFVAVDRSAQMMELHPRNRVEKILCDFDSEECWRELRKYGFDQIFSSSAMQWSSDLDALFEKTASFGVPCSFAIFTSGTFKTVHEIAGLDSPIYSVDEILYFVKKYFLVNYEIKRYRLFFSRKREIFSYIKKSGVNVGRRRLGYTETKRMMENYPLSYLEFEVLFLWTK